MKKNFYQHITKVSDNAYLYYNAFSDNYLILNSRLHSIYINNEPEDILSLEPSLYEILRKEEFLIEDNIDEFSITEYKKLQKKYDTNLYNIVINTTLDCNLRCWYCYENKIEGSILEPNIIDYIKNNIQYKYSLTPFKKLKISFFGGEPFLNFNCVEKVLNYAREFTKEKQIELIADFTTNATLITKTQLDFLSDFTCTFQITLDGCEEKHNTVRFYKESKIGTYNDIVKNIHRIHDCIPNSYIWVRVNFDKLTLLHFSDILYSLNDLNRYRVFIILRKIWQLPDRSIDKSLLLEALQKAIDAGFFVDYYTLAKNELCFAERENQLLINYDGKIFKCSTLECFDKEHSYGELLSDGSVKWDINQQARSIKYLSGEECKNCKLYPACLGRCSQKKSKQKQLKCFLENLDLSIDELIMYNYKLNRLWLSMHQNSKQEIAHF